MGVLCVGGVFDIIDESKGKDFMKGVVKSYTCMCTRGVKKGH